MKVGTGGEDMRGRPSCDSVIPVESPIRKIARGPVCFP